MNNSSAVWIVGYTKWGSRKMISFCYFPTKYNACDGLPPIAPQLNGH
jgi:hypothetical protein